MVTEIAQHVIVAPVDDAVDWLAGVRGRFDPLASAVPPHVTLVYPFEACLAPEAVRAHMVQVLAGFPSFQITLDGVSGAERSYLRYDIKQGNDALIAMHDALYSGPLASYLDLTESVHPHLTIGRLADAGAWRQALDELVGTAPRMTVEVRRVISYRRYPEGARQLDNTVEL
jgi:2'-5' RNA ligase